MIVIDTSALLAIVKNEVDAEACQALLEGTDAVCMSAGTMAETWIVALGKGRRADVKYLIDGLHIEVVDVTADFAQKVADAYGRWGKGFDPAGLNFGDCFAYALARERDCPLLYVGNDFSLTDIRSAIARS